MKKENYILIAGVILCGVISSPYVLDPSLVVRHIVWCVTTLLLCACLFLRKRKNLSNLNMSIFHYFFIYCMAAIISIFKAANTSESMYAILVSLVTLMFFVCITAVIDKKIITKAFVYFGLFLAIYGLYDVGRAYCNVPDIKTVFGLGFANGRNLWSSTLMLFIPFSLYHLAKNKSKTAALTLILLLANIIILQTRSVYLALIIATTISLFFYRKRLVIPLCLLIIICVCLSGRLRNTESLDYRFQCWTRTVKTFCDEPLLGVGAGNWKVATPRYGNVRGVSGRQQYYQRAHNDFLEVLSEIGFVGGLCYILIFVAALGYSRRSMDKTLAWTMRFGIVSYMVFAFFSFPKERAIHSIIIFIMIALILKEYPIKKEWSEKRNIKTFAVCTIIILFALFVNYHRHQAEVFTRKFLIARNNKEWKKIVDIINKNYTPFATMAGHTVSPILQYRAEANFYLGNHDESLADYLEANKLHPNHSSILCNIGYYKITKKDYRSALLFYSRANDVHPGLEVITKPLQKLREVMEQDNDYTQIRNTDGSKRQSRN